MGESVLFNIKNTVFSSYWGETKPYENTILGQY